LGLYKDSKLDVLSGGYKHRVLIARAQMHKPKLLILDEPTVGLDPHIRHQLWETIRELKNEGITVILTTHYIDEAEVLSDRICILEKGKIKLIDTPQNLLKSYKKGKLEAAVGHKDDAITCLSVGLKVISITPALRKRKEDEKGFVPLQSSYVVPSATMPQPASFGEGKRIHDESVVSNYL